MRDAQPVWIPDPSRKSNSALHQFIRSVEEKLGIAVSNYHELHQWSVHSYNDFWRFLLSYSGIRFTGNTETAATTHSIFTAEWFPGVRLNFAENLLAAGSSECAIISVNESGRTEHLTFDELKDGVLKVAAFLSAAGIAPGDRVAGFVTNRVEAVIAMLASAALGAIWTSCSPDFGFQGVLDRFGQAEPKALFAVNQYAYGGKIFDCSAILKRIADEIKSIRHVVFIENDAGAIHATFGNDVNVSRFNELLRPAPELSSFNAFPFDHPLYLLYSSGTTGKPKCILHGAGGTLLQHYKEHALHCDIRKGDRVFYYTTCGWMMWNWLVSALARGATIVLYDGNPAFPNIGTLWNLIDKLGITVFGTSPKFLSASEKSLYSPITQNKLDTLRTILSTGSPLVQHNFEYVYSRVKKDVHLASISGGTDIISCFLLGNPLSPVYPEEIQCAGLGMAINVYSPDGKPLSAEKGELVCEKPFPSRPVSFWNDRNREKFFTAYFARYPEVWHHGDFVLKTERESYIVFGRSDATLNPGGVRIGTAEIYRVIESLPDISDSLVIGQKHRDDTRILLFVVLKNQGTLESAMEKTLRETIRDELTPRHVPARIIQVEDIPRTLSGKKMEIAVTRLLHGESIDNIEAVANPESLRCFSPDVLGL